MPLLLDVSDVAYTFEILYNCEEVWEQGWHYSPDNRDGANANRKEQYAKFKKMKKEDILRLSGTDQVNYSTIKFKTYRYTSGTTKTRNKHGISTDGMKFFEKHKMRYGAFLKNEKMKEAFVRYWDKHDEEHNKVDKVLFNGRGLGGNKRRRSGDDEDGVGEDDASPRGVIFLRGEEGYKDPFEDYETDEEGEDSRLNNIMNK